MWKSPLEMTINTQIENIVHDFTSGTDDLCLKAVMNVGINASKDELIRALQYDRDQYECGYADGYNDGCGSVQMWINADDYQPPEGEWVLCYIPDEKLRDGYSVFENIRTIGEKLKWAGKPVKWWMPRPGKPDGA